MDSGVLPRDSKSLMRFTLRKARRDHTHHIRIPRLKCLHRCTSIKRSTTHHLNVPLRLLPAIKKGE